MGRKAITKDRDRSEVQRLKHENQKLKKEVSRLRKLVSRVEDYREEVEELAFQEESLYSQDVLITREQLLKQWKCFSCSEGTLVLYLFDRPDGKFYQRRCSGCRHRTRLKPYTPDIKGITNEVFKDNVS